MADARVEKFAQILVDYSTETKPGDRVAIEATTAAAPLVRALCATVLERGGHPHLLLELPDQDEILFAHAKDDQLDFIPTFRKLAYERFESRIRVQSLTNPRALTSVDPARQKRHQKALSPILETQMRRGADRSLKWVSTLYPTEGYAMEAEMSLADFEDFVYRACHADDADPVAYWKQVEANQARIVTRLAGHDQVVLRGPNVNLSLSINGRTFINAAGKVNMPDGEVFSGPVEDSVNGWVRFTYPAIYVGVLVEGVELTFSKGKVTKAQATKNQAFLLEMLASDPGASYVGEFAIGTNYEIDRFSHNILFDEKLGGSFHMALGAGYPDTGSKNKSLIHWDMICGMKEDAEILVDGEVIYKNGRFTF
jgi:aminopeptidase